MFESVLNLIFPVSCRLCGAVCTTSTPICPACDRDLPRIQHACQRCGIPLSASSGTACGHCQSDPPLFASLFAPFHYQDPISQLIGELKYQHKLATTRLLSDLLLDFIRVRKMVPPQALLPVPLHRQRIRERGFNQAIEIARPLAEYWGIPLLTDAVIRHKHTKSQTGLSARLRQDNLRGAFELDSLESFDHIAIIDDVVTTGATTRELANCLNAAGVPRVDVVALARAGK